MGRATINNITRKWAGYRPKDNFNYHGLAVHDRLHAAQASYMPFNTNVNMNVGIGTSTPQAAFVVTNGNIGIGTWTASGGNLIVNGGGNVGINSAWPGVALDVNGKCKGNGALLREQGINA